jgi:hypothetical protein
VTHNSTAADAASPRAHTMRSLSSLGVALALVTLALLRTPRQVDAHAAVIPSIIQDERLVRMAWTAWTARLARGNHIFRSPKP